MLSPTPADRLVDPGRRPYFLWDCEMTIDEFRENLRSSSREGRAYLVGKLMRQARPDDVFEFVALAEIGDLWVDLERYLGKTREFWTWILKEWGTIG